MRLSRSAIVSVAAALLVGAVSWVAIDQVGAASDQARQSAAWKHTMVAACEGAANADAPRNSQGNQPMELAAYARLDPIGDLTTPVALVALEHGRAGGGFVCGDGDWTGPIALPTRAHPIYAVWYPTARTRGSHLGSLVMGYVVRSAPGITSISVIADGVSMQGIRPHDGFSAFYFSVPEWRSGDIVTGMSTVEFVGFGSRGSLIGTYRDG
jgi:hypothetical protein